MNENLYNYGLLEVKGAIVLGFIDKMGDFFFPRTEEEVAAEGGNTAAAAENTALQPEQAAVRSNTPQRGSGSKNEDVPKP